MPSWCWPCMAGRTRNGGNPGRSGPSPHPGRDLDRTIDLLGFLTLGLLGGFGHCVGMCSPFVLFVSRRYGRPEPSEKGSG